MSYIYKITNIKNNKIYIGKTIQNPTVRFRQHNLGMGFGKKMPIHLAMQKHGVDNFKLEVVYTCFNEKDAGFAEVYFINFYNCLAPNGYNVDINTKYMKDNPYLIEEFNSSSAVQSIPSEPGNAEYNLGTRARCPIDLWKTIKSLYEAGKSPKEINKLLNINIFNNTMTNKLKALGCDTTSKTRNRIRGNGKYLATDQEKLNIIEDYKNNLSCVQLEKKYKRAGRFIKTILVNAGLYVSLDKKICRTYERS